MASARKLPSGNWRVNLFVGYVDNKRKYKSFTAPTKKEAEYAAAEYALNAKRKKNVGQLTVGEAIDKYIAAKDGILSPSTIEGYRKIRTIYMQDIMDIQLDSLTQDDIQQSINTMCKTVSVRRKRPLSPKTVREAHGLLSSTIHTYMPEFRLTTTLPAKIKSIKELPDAQEIFNAVVGTPIELPVLLAMWLSFSMSEIRGIRWDAISNGFITVKHSVIDVRNTAIEKDATKAYERTRKHKIPPYIEQLIKNTEKEGDHLITLSGKAIYNRFVRLIKKADLPKISFHGLRHVNASVMLALKIPDKYAMERGGWKTPHVLKNVYQHTLSPERLEVDKTVNNFFEGIVQHEMQHDDEKTT